MLHWGVGRRFVRLGPASNPAGTLIAAMTVPPDATRTALINTTFTALAPILPKLGIFFVLAAHDSQAARLNWINPAIAPLVATNSPAFVIDRGYTGDGTTSGLATNGITLTNAAPQYLQDSAHMWGWSLTDAANANYDFGTQGGGNVYFQTRSATNFVFSKFNSATLSSTVANPNSLGMLGADRNNAADYQHYKNGVSLGTAQAAVSAVPTALTFCVCRGQAGFSIRQMAATGAGGSLTPAEWVILYDAVHYYLQQVGASA